MITGKIVDDEARVRLKVRGDRGKEREIEAVVDTGYTALLTLPSELVAALGLRWRSVDRATLADGSDCLFDVYEANVWWDGKLRHVLVDETQGDPLIGMGLLSGYELKMQVRPNGKISIKRMPRK